MFFNPFVLLLDALGDFAPPPLGIPRSVFHVFNPKNVAFLFGFFTIGEADAYPKKAPGGIVMDVARCYCCRWGERGMCYFTITAFAVPAVRTM